MDIEKLIYNIEIQKQRIEKLILFIEIQRGMAIHAKEKWSEDTTWGDTERRAVDVEFGKEVAFDIILHALNQN